ncbi:Hypothetical protein, putative [Bodo saltans]|uniref:Uncharacterized protein n=1 Tax=Bodo saltans TaxID=75058 RepID=A0A0S4JJJ3_BODSA|nr:Hypothetical protein, putative [Bodo saltans]|eukprot:CUG90384.1 Hypothetical protein, putative [Bodo saltans]
MRALTHLTSLGVQTIGQFGQSTANISQLDSGVRGFLNQCLVRYLWDFFDPIVAAFKERVDTSNLTATVPKPYAAHLRMRELTYRHPYGDKLHMLGEDRISTLERIVLNSFEPLDSKKEDNPINYLIAAPRQGKSLMLDEVVARAASLGHGFYGVGISFNNKSTLRMQDISKSVRTVTSEFWGRVAHSLYLAMLPEGAPELNFGSFRDLPFFGVFNCDVVHALAQKLKLGRVVIAADEISKLTAMIVKQGFSKEDEKAVMTTITEMYSRDWSLLCSGFTMRDAYVMATKSGRPTMEHFLCMVSRQTREEYTLMKKYLEKLYPGDAFTPALRGLYEIVKNVPGYMGLWIEMKVKFNNNEEKATDVLSIEDLTPPFLKYLVEILLDNPQLFTDYWRAVANCEGNGNELKVVPDGVLSALEILGAILPRVQEAEQDKTAKMQRGKKQVVKEAGRYYLSPLVITHPRLKSAREHSLIATAVKLLLRKEQWTIMGKGKALEAVLIVRLALTAAYVNDAKAREINPAEEVSVGTLIKRLCGQLHTNVITHIDLHKVDERLPAKFPDYSDAAGFSLAHVSKSEVQKACDPEGYDDATNSTTGKAIVKDLSAFPVVWSEKKDKDGRPQLASKAKQAERLEENVKALNSPHFSVLSPQCPMNVGCDVALLFRVGKRHATDKADQKVLFLFETKYYASESGTPDTVWKITKKAYQSLNGVSQYVKRCNIRRVCFVYCNTAVRDGVNAIIHHSGDDPKKGPFLMEFDCSTDLDMNGRPVMRTESLSKKPAKTLMKATGQEREARNAD